MGRRSAAGSLCLHAVARSELFTQTHQPGCAGDSKACPYAALPAGTGLGRNQQGISAPIDPVAIKGGTGLGFDLEKAEEEERAAREARRAEREARDREDHARRRERDRDRERRRSRSR